METKSCRSEWIFAEELLPLTILKAMRNATLPMISYAPDPVQEIKAMDGVVLEVEQGIKSGNLAMVDVTAHGPSFGETIR
jgi:hypothetical protein